MENKLIEFTTSKIENHLDVLFITEIGEAILIGWIDCVNKTFKISQNCHILTVNEMIIISNKIINC